MKAPAAALRTDINITPLIDIVLVLLIVFIVMVPSLYHAQRTQSPDRGDGLARPQADLPRLVLRGDGTYQLDGVDLPAPEIVERLLPLLRARAKDERKVHLTVPPDAAFQDVSRALDLVHEAAGRIGHPRDVRTVLVEQK